MNHDHIWKCIVTNWTTSYSLAAERACERAHEQRLTEEALRHRMQISNNPFSTHGSTPMGLSGSVMSINPEPPPDIYTTIATYRCIVCGEPMVRELVGVGHLGVETLNADGCQPFVGDSAP